MAIPSVDTNSDRTQKTVSRIGVFGAYGHTGTEVCKAVEAAQDLELVAKVGSRDRLSALSNVEIDVVVDFTTPEVVMDNLRWCLQRGINAVVGTSGFNEERLETVRSWLSSNPGVGAVVTPSFGIGVALMGEFAARAAPHFESIEIIEQHHAEKEYAPSRTAERIARAVAESRAAVDAAPMPDGTEVEQPGARGSREFGVPVHSVRARGMVAHHEVLLGIGDEVLTLRHDSFVHAFFMHGVLLAVREVVRRPGLTVGLGPLLG